MGSFWTGFEKRAKTRFIKEFLKNPAKFEKLFGKGISEIANKSLLVAPHGAMSGFGQNASRRLFDSHRSSIPIRELSYRNPLKRMATVRMSDGTFKQLDIEVPKNFSELPVGGEVGKFYHGIHTPELITEMTGEGLNSRGAPILSVKKTTPNTQTNVLGHIKNLAKALKSGGTPPHRVIGSKRKVLLTHMTEGGAKRVTGEVPHYLSVSGHYDLNRPGALFAHVGEVKGSTGGARSEFKPDTKITSVVPESAIVYRPPNTPTDKEDLLEAVVPREVFAKNVKSIQKIK